MESNAKLKAKRDSYGAHLADRYYIPKVKIRVHVEMTDGAQMGGNLFVPANIRVLDVLNAPAYIILFLRDDSYMVMLNKFGICRIVSYDLGARIHPRQRNFSHGRAITQ
jgi:hypothetical protein